jgi:hypothetical protein
LPKKRAAGKGDKPGDFLFNHDLINRLAIIVGHCDLLKDLVEVPIPMKHVDLIKTTALAMAEVLKGHQRGVQEMKKAG